MIRRIASTYEAKPELAEELVQEIFFAIWRALPSFRGQSSLRTFIARIATNNAATHVVRALKSPSPFELDDDIPESEHGPEDKAIALDQENKLMSAIRNLPLAYRQVATLTLEGLTPTEISQTLGLTANAVAIRLTRAKELLRERIGDRA